MTAPTTTALTMMNLANRNSFCATAFAASLGVCLALAAEQALGDNAGQAPAPAAEQTSPPPAAPGAGPATAGPPSAPPQPTPNYQPGFLHRLKIWWDDSVALFERKDRNPPSPADTATKTPDDTGPAVTDKAKEAAASAITSTQDAMKSAVEATKGAASTAGDAMKGAVEATKDAAAAIGRLPNIRVMQVSEVCARAPNGGSDCGAAATNVCRAKGFNGGAPLDVRTGSRCDPKPQPQPQAGQTPTVHCARESVVTRVVCQ
jgi:hypothetical protein